MIHSEFELQILELVKLHLELMRRIADALESLVSDRATTVKAPNYQIPLERWKDFDWASIGAVVTASDASGPTTISWRNQQYIRQSPSNRYEAAVWYSRCIGKDSKGENQYERLITFKPLANVEPVPERVSRLVR